MRAVQEATPAGARVDPPRAACCGAGGAVGWFGPWIQDQPRVACPRLRAQKGSQVILWMPAQWVAVGICLYAGVHFVQSNGGTRRVERMYFAFGVLCLWVAVYLALTALMQAQTAVDSAALVERLRTAAGCMIYPTAFWFLALYTHMARWRPWAWLTALVFFSLGVIGLLRPYGLLLDNMHTMPALVLPWGERVQQFQGSISPLAWIYFAATYLLFLWAFWRCLDLWRARESARARALAIYLLVQIAAVVYAQIGTVMRARGPDLEALPFLVLVLLVSRVLSREWLQRGDDLAASVQALALESDVREQAQDALRHVAYHDGVTGLCNRNGLLEQLAELQAETRGTATAGTLLLLGLDGFRPINDALGHGAGDALLREIAQRIGVLHHGARCIARLDGAEFALLLTVSGVTPEQHAASALQRARELRQAMEQPLRFDAHELVVAANVGAVQVTGAGEARTFLRQASIALGRARDADRDGVLLFSAEMQSHAERRLRLEHDLRSALTQRQIDLVFQPQVDASGFLVGAEALMRWQHPTLGAINPTEFIPLAEESGLIHALGMAALEGSCIVLRDWPPAAPRLRIAVNVSPWQLLRPDFVESVAAIQREFRVQPGALMLEITESVFIRDAAAAAATVRRLHRLGVGVAIDDFGTGYASLASLRDLPVEEVKIDQAFVRKMRVDVPDRFIGAMIDLAHALQMYVIAEGVESEAQRCMLRELRCDAFQGYAIGMPMDAIRLRDFARALPPQVTSGTRCHEVGGWPRAD